MFILRVWYNNCPFKKKNNNVKGKKHSIESKFQKKFVKFNPNISKSSSKSTLKRKTPTYYKCGKISHTKKDCQLENKINSLEISDKLKNLMTGLMIS